MELKTKVLAQGITTLTDARYFSSKNVSWLGFNFDAGAELYLAPEQAVEISKWVNGPRLVGMFGAADVEAINRIAASLDLELVVLSSRPESTTLAQIQSPIYLSVGIQTESELPEIERLINEFATRVEGFILRVGTNLNLGTAQFKKWCDTHRIILQANQNRILTLIASLNVYGVVVEAGDEIRTGLRDFEAVDELMEALAGNAK